MSRKFEFISTNQLTKDAVPVKYIKLPQRATASSAGYDIYSPVDFILEPGDDVKVPTGWKVEMNPGEFLMIVPRSGLGFKYYTRLANTAGIIDADYYNNPSNEGHVWVKIRNEGTKPITISAGMAICQGIFLNYLLTDDDVSDGNRTGGFGSTSTN